MARLPLLGVEVDAMTMQDLNEVILRAGREHSRIILAHHNTHSVYLFHHDARMRAFYSKATWIHVDGMPLIFVGRLMGRPLRRAHRVTYVDWVRPLMGEAARHGLRVFYLGSRPGVADRAAAVLRAEFPNLQMATHHGHFDPSADAPENTTVLDAIRNYHPHLLMVGMGMPRQEHWIADNLDHLGANAILTSGACMDYVAGVIPTAPRWLSQIGLEWLHRLLGDPRRLWRRYLLEPWFVLGLAFKDVLRKEAR